MRLYFTKKIIRWFFTKMVSVFKKQYFSKYSLPTIQGILLHKVDIGNAFLQSKILRNIYNFFKVTLFILSFFSKSVFDYKTDKSYMFVNQKVRESFQITLVPVKIYSQIPINENIQSDSNK